jgi:hypothetical protein
MLLLLALGCPPKTPPPGSMAVERAPVERADPAPGLLVARPDNPLPLGSALPFEAAESPGEIALVSGEAILANLERMPEPDSVLMSRLQAQESGDAAEEAIALFQRAASEPELGPAATARTGDAWRLAARAVLELLPPDPTMEGFDKALTASAEPLLGQATAAYSRVASDTGADVRWRGHALWGLHEIERMQEQP